MSLPKPGVSNSVKKITTTKSNRLRNERLNDQEVREFMTIHGISDKEMAVIFGVSLQAVRLWTSGQREFSVTNSRLIKLFNKYPNLIREF